jgi:hypothetical protein
MPQFSDLAALVKAAGRTAKCNIPAQGQFFQTYCRSPERGETGASAGRLL